MIITGVANTGGNVASLKRLARCSAVTTSVNEPLAPTGMAAMRLCSLRRPGGNGRSIVTQAAAARLSVATVRCGCRPCCKPRARVIRNTAVLAIGDVGVASQTNRTTRTRQYEARGNRASLRKVILVTPLDER